MVTVRPERRAMSATRLALIVTLLGATVAACSSGPSADKTVTVGPEPESVAVSPDSRRVYVGDDGDLTVIDASSNKVVKTIKTGSEWSITVSPDGHTIYAATQPGPAKFQGVTVIDARSGIVTKKIRLPAPQASLQPWSVTVSPDGRRVYVTNGSAADRLGFVDVVSTSTGQVTNTITVGGNPRAVALSKDGRTLAVANCGGCGEGGSNERDTVSLISTASNEVTRTVAVGVAPHGIGISPDGSHAYVAIDGLYDDHHQQRGHLLALDTATGAITGKVAVGLAPSAVAVSPDGSTIYVTNEGYGGDGSQDSVSVINAGTLHVVRTIHVGEGPSGVAVAPNDKHVYTSNLGTSDLGSLSVINIH